MSDLYLFSDENDFKKYLEDKFLPLFFDNGWKPIYRETKEVYIRSHILPCTTKIDKRDIIDYFGFKKNIPTYIEVKNDRIRQKYLLQITRYFCQMNEEYPIFNFYVICEHKIRPHREKILDVLGIKILDIKEVKEDTVGLDTWI